MHPSPTAGTLYEYSERLYCFEFGQLHSPNVLIFVGGLGDGFNTVPYLPLLSERLNSIGWSLVQIQLTSSYIGWGTGSLWRDSTEIGQLVAYLKSETAPGGSRKRIGLMGHSTGCQNTVHYFTRQPRDDNYTELDFGIIQAPVSDRYYCKTVLEPFDEALAVAEKLVEQGNEKEYMPYKYCKYFFGVPINAYRWTSLFRVRGDDDFFSPDLEIKDFQSTFGKFDKPLLVLYSGADEYVPEDVDKAAVMAAFKEAAAPGVWSKYSKIVPGAHHNIDADGVEDAVSTVVEFISDVN